MFELYLNIELQTVLHEQSKVILNRLVNKAVRAFQQSKDERLSPEDSGLLNLWDEICCDAQEETVFHHIYETHVLSYVRDNLMKELTENERKILWLQTKEYNDWEQELRRNDDDINFSFKIPDTKNNRSMQSDIVKLITEIIFNYAFDYTNSRIEKYLYLYND